MALFQKRNYVKNIENHLYDRANSQDFSHSRHEFEKRDFDTPKEWNNLEEEGRVEEKIKKSGNIFLTIFLIAILFFASSVGIAFYMFSGERNVISEEEIELVIFGLTQVASGVEFSLDINIQNRSAVPLENVELFIEYPIGTRDHDGKTLTSEYISIGTIDAQSFSRKILNQAIFGEEFRAKTIRISMGYRLPGSNSVFKREKDYTVTLITTPLSIVVDSYNEVASGQELSLGITITSNSDRRINNLVLQLEYPFGWTFVSSNPAPSQTNNTWFLPELAPNASYKLNLIGNLSGTDDDLRKFQFKVGILDEGRDLAKVSPITEYIQNILIRQPFLGLAIEWQNGVIDGIINSGERVVGSIRWVNNTNAVIRDATIIMNLSGNALDKNTVRADRGLYSATENIIVWNSRDNSELANIPVGGNGSLRFEFNTIDTREPSQVDLSLNVSGNRVVEGGSQAQVAAIEKTTLKTITNISLASQVLHYSGPFETSGPMPPRVNQETTYTVIWTITNSRNNVDGVTVRTKLPSYVSWKNIVAPSAERITYDPMTGEVVWNAGTVSGGSGFDKSAREIAFMIGFTPSLNQVGSSPMLIDAQTLSGVDSFTQRTLSDRRNSFTTWIVNDPGFKVGEDRVVQ